MYSVGLRDYESYEAYLKWKEDRKMKWLKILGLIEDEKTATVQIQDTSEESKPQNENKEEALEILKAQLMEMLKDDLINKASELGLETYGTKSDLSDRIARHVLEIKE